MKLTDAHREILTSIGESGASLETFRRHGREFGEPSAAPNDRATGSGEARPLADERSSRGGGTLAETPSDVEDPADAVLPSWNPDVPLPLFLGAVPLLKRCVREAAI
jgi:hypothetical protein